jgi:hypothetical protein
VTDRRQFLAGLAALPLSAAAGRSADTAASLADAIESVPCSDPTPGSVINPRGAVGQTSLTDLVDAYSQVDGLDPAAPAVLGPDQQAGCLRPLPPKPSGGLREVVDRWTDRLPQRPAAGPVRDRHLPRRRRGHRPGRYAANGGRHLPAARLQLLGRRPAVSDGRHGHLHHRNRHTGRRQLRPAVPQQHGARRPFCADVSALYPASDIANVSEGGSADRLGRPVWGQGGARGRLQVSILRRRALITAGPTGWPGLCSIRPPSQLAEQPPVVDADRFVRLSGRRRC